jgi:7,8-dihydropterin-6-yl-methyl-4-(beta-D-ribofuranosyl)aminobenzene 5'-phosphate synthase
MLNRSDLDKAENDMQITVTTTDIAFTETTIPNQNILTEENMSKDMIVIQVVFDNYSVRNDLAHDWGFSAHISIQDQNILFDTGASGSILLSNMQAMGIQPGGIQHIILSHEHNDHTGGLGEILTADIKPDIYLLPSFSDGFKNRFKNLGNIVEVNPGQKIIDRVFTTGEVTGSIREQALIIDSVNGLVIITGCAHPGVENMVLAAKQIIDKEIYLVMGGFHLAKAGEYKVSGVIEELHQLGVEKIAPCHCTGDNSINQFKEAYGENFIKIGVGTEIQINY